jgi:ubiquinone/menaquinone biosynthesis C-methylase UbiE
MDYMYNHFSQLAPCYRDLRITDVEPVAFIGETLKIFSEVKAADVGCGDGRYDLLLFQHLNNLHLSCIDTNAPMLEHVSDYLTNHNLTQFETIQAGAEDFPLKNNSMDCVLTFNAVHHFDFLKFLEKAAEVIKAEGKIFIYTRSRSQNARNIWGQYFPAFVEKETRLYELNEMEQWIQSVDSLTLETVKPFKYERNSTLERLVEQAKGRHYSTFSLYKEEELDEALKAFQDNIKKAFQKTDQIEWFDENVLLVLKPKRK